MTSSPAGGHGEHFIHRLGHGIGLEVHEEPYVVSSNPTALRAGDTFSIEPGIYLEGRFGVRIEDVVVGTAEGGRVAERHAQRGSPASSSGRYPRR